jgi:hypothetical protein
MSLEMKIGTDRTNEQPETNEDVELDESLRNFRMSVLAWSEAMLNRPRPVAQVVRRRSWRLAAGWALGCALLASSATGVIYERHHRQELARIAAEQLEAQHQRQLREQMARQDEEDLLAKVDSDVSRTVPSAMEPLARLMTGDETR